MRYFVRNDVCQLLPRKFKIAFTADRRATARSPASTTSASSRASRDGVRRASRSASAAAPRSCRASRPTLYDFVEVDDGDYLKVSEAVLRIFDRQDWLRANRARARIKFLVDQIGIDEFREQVDEELKGDWVDERDFDPTPLLFIHDEEANAPAPRRQLRLSPNGDRSRVRRASRAANVTPAAPGGLLDGRGEGHPRRPRRPSSSAASPQIMRDFTGGYARTTVQQNLVLRWVRDEAVYDVWQRLEELGLGDAGARPDHRRRQLPRHRQLQARHHELDGPERGGPGAARGDGDRRPAHASRSTSR